jgi:hypothetical protein
MILYVKFQKIESTGEYYMITVSTPSRICLLAKSVLDAFLWTKVKSLRKIRRKNYLPIRKVRD